MNIREIIKATSAKTIGTINNIENIKISTDTRTIKQGDLYLPLKGASFDGEKFIEQALEKGAIGAFYTDDNNISTVKDNSKILLKVNDTLKAYLQLANFRRNKLNFKVVAITGSSGKTTTKELVASTLSAKFKTFKTPLNHNNEIGFCQTIFETPDDTEVLVLEMGMRGIGEIELLSQYSEPDITIISNVGTAHIGRLGSRENIAKAKCEIVKYQRGKTFIAHDDELIKKTIVFDGDKIYYSINDVEILSKEVSKTKFVYENNQFEINVGGDYNVENALASINAGKVLGMSLEEIQKGLKNYAPIEKRWETVEAGGYKFINDSYNANPESMRAFVNTIFDLYENYILILGDMGELGEDEVKYHAELGQYINNHKKLKTSAKVITIGSLSQNISNNISKCPSYHFENIDLAVDFIRNNISKEANIFLKASRSMKFEKIIETIK